MSEKQEVVGVLPPRLAATTANRIRVLDRLSRARLVAPLLGMLNGPGNIPRGPLPNQTKHTYTIHHMPRGWTRYAWVLQ
jgi:hypothetical protein